MVLIDNVMNLLNEMDEYKVKVKDVEALLNRILL